MTAISPFSSVRNSSPSLGTSFSFFSLICHLPPFLVHAMLALQIFVQLQPASRAERLQHAQAVLGKSKVNAQFGDFNHTRADQIADAHELVEILHEAACPALDFGNAQERPVGRRSDVLLQRLEAYQR